ncbi:MAG: adenosine kinase [bacterium]|nr:adenosine kinase [bacterium]
MENINADKKLIAGIGSALVDVLIHEDDKFLEETGAAKGGMTLVSNEFLERTLALATGEQTVVPGGSACNTIIGVGRLGGPARFVGKRGEDYLGELFESGLRNSSVEPLLMKSSLPTGRVLSIITSDAQRSMFTYLGASAESKPEEITADCFEGAAIVYIEGYLLFNKDLMLAALKAARQAGALIALDLASYTVVEQSKDYLERFVEEYVDILIANEDEARAFTGHNDETKALRALSRKSYIAALKIGKRGSYITRAGRTVQVAPQGTGAAVDTTGAGDLWAAGFLYGLVHGYPLETCGELASACGFEVCQVVGASISEEGWNRIKRVIEK